MTESPESSTDDSNGAERRLRGLAVSRGVGIGPVIFIQVDSRKFFRIDLKASEVKRELTRLRNAVFESKTQLFELSSRNNSLSTQVVSDIFDVHSLIIDNSSLVERAENAIVEQKVNAEWALKMVSDHYLEKQANVTDSHLQEKYLDIDDVVNRILMALSGSHTETRKTYDGAVIAAIEIRPSVMMDLAKSSPAAIISERGGWTSHSSILARELKLPVVTGLKDIEGTFLKGETVIVDGITGDVIVNPTLETQEAYQQRAKLYDPGSPDANQSPIDGTVTTDGVQISIRANADTPDVYKTAQKQGSSGIGLFRSESLLTKPGIMDSEDDQMRFYRRMAVAAGEAGANIRTFDISVDQLLGNRSLPERNPSLGLRSIRLGLSEPSHFRIQIRAILRAAAGQFLNILLPMISSVEEIWQAKAIVDEEKEKLRAAGTSFGDPKIGAMIEVPSAVLTAPTIARNVDFICLGTNDLVQYLLAVDRDNEAIGHLYQSLHPSVIRAISEVISAADIAKIPVTICGEMAGSAFYVPLLIGLGAREISMNVNSINPIRRLISGIAVSACKSLVESLVDCETADQIETLLRSFYVENWAALFPYALLDSKHR